MYPLQISKLSSLHPELHLEVSVNSPQTELPETDSPSSELVHLFEDPDQVRGIDLPSLQHSLPFLQFGETQLLIIVGIQQGEFNVELVENPEEYEHVDELILGHIIILGLVGRFLDNSSLVICSKHHGMEPRNLRDPNDVPQPLVDLGQTGIAIPVIINIVEEFTSHFLPLGRDCLRQTLIQGSLKLIDCMFLLHLFWICLQAIIPQ